MNDEFIAQIHADLDSFYELLLGKLENINSNSQEIIKMMEALHQTENFDELANLVEEELEDGKTYSLFSEIIKYLPQNKNFVDEVVALVCARDLISPEDLEVVSTWEDLTWDYDSDDYNRSKCGMATAACNTHTDPSVLKKIASNCSWEIACRVASNTSTSWETLCQLTSRAIDSANGFEDYAIPSVVLTIFMRTDMTEAKLLELRKLIANHEVIELVDRYLADRDDPELLRFLL